MAELPELVGTAALLPVAGAIATLGEGRISCCCDVEVVCKHDDDEDGSDETEGWMELVLPGRVVNLAGISDKSEFAAVVLFLQIIDVEMQEMQPQLN